MQSSLSLCYESTNGTYSVTFRSVLKKGEYTVGVNALCVFNTDRQAETRIHHLGNVRGKFSLKDALPVENGEKLLGSAGHSE